jgi:muramoyltetrapeptide carboxypeptidase
VPRLIAPRALPEGGTIGIAAPAGPVDPKRLASSEARLRAAGFRIVRRPDLLDRRSYLAGDDRRRAAELMELWARPEVDAVVCARGGYGCHRIVSYLDPEVARAGAKPLVGYSDITTLLLWQRRQAGLMGFHGPMLERGDELTASALAACLDALTGRGSERSTLEGRGAGGGRASGRLTGGSLALVVASLGTPWEVQTRDGILLLEEVGERPFRIDRCLAQLRAAGKLDGLAGIGSGALVECSDPRYPEADACEVFLEAVRPLGIPVVTELPFGHVNDNRIWPVGARAEIDGETGEVVVLERGVSGR